MIRFLLDTNVISDPIRKRPNPLIGQRLIERGEEVAISSIVVHEMRYGIERLPVGKKRRYLTEYAERVIARLEVFPYTQAAAEWHSRERVRLERLGKTRPFVDGMIAATAVVHGLTLVTCNAVDFDGYRDLVIEDWSLPEAGPLQGRIHESDEAYNTSASSE